MKGGTVRIQIILFADRPWMRATLIVWQYLSMTLL